jgi:hypothetical protein
MMVGCVLHTVTCLDCTGCDGKELGDQCYGVGDCIPGICSNSTEGAWCKALMLPGRRQVVTSGFDAIFNWLFASSPVSAAVPAAAIAAKLLEIAQEEN